MMKILSNGCTHWDGIAMNKGSRYARHIGKRVKQAESERIAARERRKAKAESQKKKKNRRYIREVYPIITQDLTDARGKLDDKNTADIGLIDELIDLWKERTEQDIDNNAPMSEETIYKLRTYISGLIYGSDWMMVSPPHYAIVKSIITGQSIVEVAEDAEVNDMELTDLIGEDIDNWQDEYRKSGEYE